MLLLYSPLLTSPGPPPFNGSLPFPLSAHLSATQPDDNGSAADHTCRVGKITCWDFALIWIWIVLQLALAIWFSPPGTVPALARLLWHQIRRLLRRPVPELDTTTDAHAPLLTQSEWIEWWCCCCIAHAAVCAGTPLHVLHE